MTSSRGHQPTKYQFAGQETDPNGLRYLPSSYDDPSTGRFLNRDPLGGSNAYAEDDPVDLVDPSGQFSLGVCGGFSTNVVWQFSASGCLVGTSGGYFGGTFTTGYGGCTSAGGSVQR